ncbi:MAG: hypothetical protein WKG07_18665 [Hymenobacter sp.]
MPGATDTLVVGRCWPLPMSVDWGSGSLLQPLQALAGAGVAATRAVWAASASGYFGGGHGGALFAGGEGAACAALGAHFLAGLALGGG